ncbi:hypothetical protein [Nonomuraea sp. NPDC023979]|uniref:hypothetical protein n=1 Tax=Nonomuraea sp. NPDC023979 TaxID=3154796 RepID=UPI0033D32142
MTRLPPHGLGARFEYELERWCRTILDGPPNGSYMLVLRDPDGEAFEVQLSEAHVRELSIDLARVTHLRQQQTALRRLADGMAGVIVAARRDDEDVANLVGYCLHAVASKMPKPWQLTAGRPGSWEAACVQELAGTGGRPPRREDLARELSKLLTTMGHQGSADGGDLVSYALGQAAAELGSLEALLGDLDDSHPAYKLAVPYADVPDSPDHQRPPAV